MDLKGEFAGWRDDQCNGSRSPLEPLGAIKQICRDRQTIGDCFARAGLRRNQEVAAGGVFSHHRGLDLCQPIEVALRQSSGERRTCGQECHGMADLRLAFPQGIMNSALSGMARSSRLENAQAAWPDEFE